MNLRKTIITTAVALTTVAMIAPATAGAVTIEELMAQIAALQAQLVQLQSSSSSSSSSSVPAACVGVTFTRNLTVGSSGADVKCLQAAMNAMGYTVATSGAGSPGNESTYFGPKTLAAVKAYQAAQGWTPANQVGPMTRAKLNAWLGGTPSPTPTPTPTPVPTGAGLNVALASNNPASGTIVDGQAIYPLAKLTLTNGDNAEVKVTGLKLQRIGVSADSSITNMYLFDGAMRLTDGAAVSSTYTNFNNSSGLFTVPAFGSKTITVAADIDGAASETFGVQVVASTDVNSNASSVKGTFPVRGNLHTLASGTLAGVNFNATTTPSSAATIDPQNDYTLWQNNVSVTTRAVDMTRISFRKTGSVKDADMQNFRLYVDGVQVGSTIANLTLNSNNESLVTFDLTASPKRLEAGTRAIKLLGDIVGGSSLTFTFNLWNVADATFVDTQYLANVLPLADSAAFSKRSTASMTVGSGTITITKKTDSPSGDVVNLATAATLAKFEIKAAGEPVKIETLYVSANVNTAAVSGLRNGMLLANGVQIGSTTTLYDPADTTYDYTTFNLGSSLIVNPGSPVLLEVKADIFDTGTGDTTNSIVAGSTIQVTIEGSSAWNNGTARISATTLDVPASDVSGNTLTVRAGGLTLSKYTAYTDQSMVPPLTNAKIGHFTLTANTTEAVTISTIEVNLDTVNSTYVTNLYAKFGNDTTSVKPTLTTASNTWSVNYSLGKGETKDLIVYADLNSSASGTGDTSVYVAGTTVSSATSVTAGTTGSYTTGTSGVQGQAVTYTTGTFTPAVDGTTPNAAIVAGGQQVVAGRFKFTTLYDAYTVTDLRFTLGAAARSAAIDSAVIKDGDTVFGTVPYDGSNSYFNFTGLNVAIPTNTSKVLTLAYNVSPYLSSSTSTTQLDLQPTLDFVKHTNSQGTQACVGTTDADQNDPTCSPTTTYNPNKEVYAFRSIPTFTEVNLTNSAIQNSTALNAYSFKVKADAKGPVALKQLKFALTWDDSAGSTSTLYLYGFKLFKNGDDITSLVTITDEDGHNLETTTASLGANEDSTQAIVYWATEDVIAAGDTATYILQLTPSGFNAADSDEGPDGFSVKLAADTAVNAVSYLANHATHDRIRLVNVSEASEEDPNIIWSDKSDLSHDETESEDDNGTASTSGDWFNGYLVKDVSSFGGEAWSR